MIVRVGHARILALLVFTCPGLLAQEYSFRYFGTADGLANLAVRQIYQDRTGFIWVSTENGIFRYDGERFEAFGKAQGMPATSGSAFGDAPDGSLLVGGDSGLYRFSAGRFEKVTLPDTTVSWAHGIQSDGKGHTYIGTNAGLLKLDSSAAGQIVIHGIPQVPNTSGPAVAGVAIDGDSVWYGCGLELCRMNRDGTTVFGRERGLPSRVWLLILKDNKGNIWARGKNAGVFVLPCGQTKFRSPDTVVLSSTLVGLPALDSGGRLLLPLTDGLLIRNANGWQKVGRSAGLRGTVYAAFEDRQHALWIGLAGRGLARWQGYGEWENYTSQSGLASDIVYEILPVKDGPVWAGTEGGLFRGVRGESGISWKKFAAVGDIPVHAIRMPPDGDLWIGTETRGAARIDSRSGAVEWFGEKQGLTGKAPYTLRFDRQWRLWAATDTGLFVAQPPYRAFARVIELPSVRFWTFAEGADGVLWAGGAGGLFMYASGRWQNFTSANGLSNDEVISLAAAPDGKMWVGYRYGGGIDRVHMAGALAIEKRMQRRGTDGIVYFLEFDAAGRLWAGTERGVDIWDGSRWSHYDTTDGLAWEDCNLNAFASEADGTVWIGTSGGLSRFHPHPRVVAQTPPEVVFTKLLMGTANALTARYSVLNAAREGGVNFRYRLTPASTEWTETTRRELEFAQLAPGKYVLEVQAGESDNLWSTLGGRFAFEVPRPWFTTWWFLGVGALTPLLMLAAALRIRMLRATRREIELVRIVAEKTTDLRRANDDLFRLSFLDPLTGIANRRIFDQTMTKECARLADAGSCLSLVFLDVDHFKDLNDSCGHLCGDEYLVMVATTLRRQVRRERDVAARYGGEEFAIILPDTDAEQAALFAESVRIAIMKLALPHPASPVGPVLTVSAGVATATRDRDDKPHELIEAADAALYEAKRAGRNRVGHAAVSRVGQALSRSRE